MRPLSGRHNLGLTALLLLTLIPRNTRAQLLDTEVYALTRVDRLEYAPGLAGRPLRLDAVGWIGGDFDRFWWRIEGEKGVRDSSREVELHALYGRLITPFWDMQIGLRLDRREDPEKVTRALLAVGMEGLAPYWFEVTSTLFLSQNGKLSARFTAEYDLFLFQRLILQPRVEVNAALQAVPTWGIGSGLNELDAGFRLCYEIRREFAPYLGYAWTRRLGEMADLARAAGESIGRGSLVAGLKVWY